MLNKFRGKFNKIILKIAYALTKIKFKPWTATLSGLILAIIASIILIINLSSYSISLSLILFLLGGFMDALDGSLARIQNRVSDWGGFYDSIIDRLTEIIYLFALAYSSIITFYIAYIYITTSILISYTRAKAESLGVKMQGIGIMERAERLIILVIAIVIWILIKYNLNIIMSILILLNIITLLQRVYYIWKEIRK